jgi:hypothetical protein
MAGEVARLTSPAPNAVCCEASTLDTCMVSPLPDHTIAPVRPLPTGRPRLGLVLDRL